MKTAVVVAFLAGANAFSTSPAVTRPTTALNSVWDDYEGGIEFRAQKFQFDPVRWTDRCCVMCIDWDGSNVLCFQETDWKSFLDTLYRFLCRSPFYLVDVIRQRTWKTLVNTIRHPIHCVTVGFGGNLQAVCSLSSRV